LAVATASSGLTGILRVRRLPAKHTSSGSRTNRRSTGRLPGEALFTPLFSHSPWRSLFHAGLRPVATKYSSTFSCAVRSVSYL
jgi:hypothetical protein